MLAMESSWIGLLSAPMSPGMLMLDLALGLVSTMDVSESRVAVADEWMFLLSGCDDPGSVIAPELLGPGI